MIVIQEIRLCIRLKKLIWILDYDAIVDILEVYCYCFLSLWMVKLGLCNCFLSNVAALGHFLQGTGEKMRLLRKTIKSMVIFLQMTLVAFNQSYVIYLFFFSCRKLQRQKC